MSYDLYLIPIRQGMQLTPARLDALLEDPTPEDAQAVNAIAPEVQRLFDARKGIADTVCITPSDGIFEVNCAFRSNARVAAKAMNMLLDFLAELTQQFNMVIYDPQLDDLIDPTSHRNRVLRQFRESGENLSDVLSLISSGATKPKRWWRFWTR